MLNFALVSPCGTGNLGDAAIQDAMIAGIRQRFPNARIVAVTLNPQDTERRHGLVTFPIAAKGWPLSRATQQAGAEPFSRLRRRACCGPRLHLFAEPSAGPFG